jgi:ABC-type Fe3+ transport system permease subunit
MAAATDSIDSRSSEDEPQFTAGAVVGIAFGAGAGCCVVLCCLGCAVSRLYLSDGRDYDDGSGILDIFECAGTTVMSLVGFALATVVVGLVVGLSPDLCCARG